MHCVVAGSCRARPRRRRRRLVPRTHRQFPAVRPSVFVHPVRCPAPIPPSNITREYPPSLRILQGNTLPPFEYYKGIPSFPSNITRQYPPSLLILQGNTLQVRTAPARVSCAERGTLLRRTSMLLSSVCAHAQAMVLALLSGGLVSCCMNTTNAECRSTASMVLCVLVSRRAAIADNCSCTCKCGVTGFGAGIRE